MMLGVTLYQLDTVEWSAPLNRIVNGHHPHPKPSCRVKMSTMSSPLIPLAKSPMPGALRWVHQRPFADTT